MKAVLGALAALAAVSVAVDLPPVGPAFSPPPRRTPAPCEVPRTLAEAHDALGRLVAPELIRVFASKDEDEVRRDDLRLGIWVRVFWGLWNGGALRDHLVELGALHPDEMSELVLVTWWRHLHDQPLRVEADVARLIDLRRAGAWQPDPRCVCYSHGTCQHQQYIRSHGGALRGFALNDCCCGFRPRVTEGVVHTAGLSAPVVFPFFPAWRSEHSALCREAAF